MGVNAMLPAVLFAVLMLSCLFACYVVAVRREDVQAWIPFIRYETWRLNYSSTQLRRSEY